ncbi:hypothetical protein [Burkholderia phage vB_BpP_HN03]|uniref:Uncharacterized protein n=1 Tax=Burkholderia phage vB_BpP_HN02 TaxID=3116925 RepID=A0AAX4JIK1_9CAUD
MTPKFLWKNAVMELDDIINSLTSKSAHTRIHLYCQNQQMAEKVKAYTCITGVDYEVFPQFFEVPEDKHKDGISYIHIVQYIGQSQSLLDWLKEQP